MISQIVVKRYAEAYVGFARDTIGLEKGIEELKALRSNVIRDNPEFISFLENKEMTFAKK